MLNKKMKKVNISSMFLMPKNIYTSMLSRINEDDTKEEIKLINREKRGWRLSRTLQDRLFQKHQHLYR